MLPLVSIVTATRNREAEFRRAYASLRQQTHLVWEWIVVDDNSTTEYAKVVAADDSRVHVFQDTGVTGKGPIRNHGIKQVAGDWYTFLDDDDELVPDALEILISEARKHRFAPKIYRAGILVQDETGLCRPAPQHIRHPDAWVRALFAITNIGGYIIPRVLRDEVSYRDTRYFQDADYFLRLACRTDIVEVDRPVYIYHRYGSSGSAGAYTSRPADDVLSEELYALLQLFETPEPKIAAYAKNGVLGLAIAARHAWHSSAFPQVSLLNTWRLALWASKAPQVWGWLLRATYLRIEYRWPLLHKFRGALRKRARVQPTIAQR